MIPAFERFVVGIAVMPLNDFPKFPSIDRFEELPKDAINVLHARPLSESRQPESIRFTLDLPGMRCGIVNRSRDSPALFAGRGRERSELGEGRGIVLNAVPKLAGRSDRAKQMPRVQARRLSTREFCCRASAVPCPSPQALPALRLLPPPLKNGGG